ncbi:MAG: carboxylating nicotinate-nucleotide diphosphorylase [Desulfobacteraceae bacterium]
MDALTGLIALALYEDSGFGDITTDPLGCEGRTGTGIITAKEPLVLSGMKVAEQVFCTLDANAAVSSVFTDADSVKTGETVMKVSGSLAAMLKSERVALNFLQRLSGIATLTRSVIEHLDSREVRVVDTRKTTPGWRRIEKAAVHHGGGCNHRMSLFDGVLIKDNHISVAGGIRNAVEAVRPKLSHFIKIEVETSTMVQVEEALSAGADIIMLDNMGVAEMKQAVDLIGKRALVEASGNISRENIREVAATGVDMISMGALTNQSRAMDLSMRIHV